MWLYIMVVFAYTVYTYCSHKQSTTRKPDLNLITIILILTAYLVELAISFTFLLHRWIQKQYPFTLTVLVVFLPPLTLMICFIIIIIRQVCIIRMAWHQSRGIVLNSEMTAVTYQISEAISRSTYYMLPKDDWDT